MPGLVQQLLLVSGETALRRADQVLHRWIARAHLLQDLFGRNAPVHHPDATRLAVLSLDARQKVAQSRLVLRVSRQHLVSERQAFRRDNESNNDLHAVRAAITRVPETALVLLAKRRVGFEVGARQVVEQHVKGDIEQVAPARHQVIKNRLLVLEQPIVTLIKLVNVRYPTIRAKQVTKGTALEPQSIQAPFCAR